jgi:hypothetical protein
LFFVNSDVPDPFKLVRRIHALEIAARQLQEACVDIAEKRKKLSPAIIGQQEENNDVLNHVCIVLHCIVRGIHHIMNDCFACTAHATFLFLTFFVLYRITLTLNNNIEFFVRQLLRDMYVLEPIADRMERSKLERKLQKQKPFYRQDETREEED